MKKLLLSIFLGTQLFGGVSTEWKNAIIRQLFANQRGLTTNEEKYTAFVSPYIERIKMLPATDLVMHGPRRSHLYRYRDLLIEMVIADFNMSFAGTKEQSLFRGLQENFTVLIEQEAEEAGSAIDAEEQVHAIVAIIREANKAYYKKFVPLHKKMVLKIASLF